MDLKNFQCHDALFLKEAIMACNENDCRNGTLQAILDELCSFVAKQNNEIQTYEIEEALEAIAASQHKEEFFPAAMNIMYKYLPKIAVNIIRNILFKRYNTKSNFRLPSTKLMEDNFFPLINKHVKLPIFQDLTNSLASNPGLLAYLFSQY